MTEKTMSLLECRLRSEGFTGDVRQVSRALKLGRIREAHRIAFENGYGYGLDVFRSMLKPE